MKWLDQSASLKRTAGVLAGCRAGVSPALWVSDGGTPPQTAGGDAGGPLGSRWRGSGPTRG
jgi:hypothetical protein